MIYKSIDLESVSVKDYCGVRVYGLNRGDVFVLNDMAVKQTFNMPIKKVKLSKTMNEYFMCIEKVKGRRWWQFWKPKYTYAKFMYLGKESANE